MIESIAGLAVDSVLGREPVGLGAGALSAARSDDDGKPSRDRDSTGHSGIQPAHNYNRLTMVQLETKHIRHIRVEYRHISWP